MTGAPYLMNKHRGGARIGHDVIVDSMYMDGLEDAYTPGKLMGNFAEDSATRPISSRASSRTPMRSRA